MKHNPDNREDNVDRIQYNIDNTIRNINLADEMIEVTSDPKTKSTLESKNKRREKALNNMRCEIKEEAIAKEKGYK